MSRRLLATPLLAPLFERAENGTARTVQATALEVSARLRLTKERALRTLATESAAAALEVPFHRVHFRPLQDFEHDLQHFGVLRVTKEQAAAQRRLLHRLRVSRLRELAARNPGFLWLGMPPARARTLGALLDHELGRGMAAQGSALAQEAQKIARGLSDELLVVWNDALPPRRELDILLKDTLAKLESGLALDPRMNATRFIRTRLFDPWRNRFMTRLGGKRDLVDRLSTQAGLQVVEGAGKGARPHFEMRWSIDGKPLVVGIDIDHAEVRLEEAVTRALGPPRDPSALLPIVRGQSLQLTEPRQNRVLFEWLRREGRETDLMRQASAGALREDEAQLVADVDAAIEKMMSQGRDQI